MNPGATDVFVGSAKAEREKAINTAAVVFEQTEHLTLARLDLSPTGGQDVVVDSACSDASTSTAREARTWIVAKRVRSDLHAVDAPAKPGQRSLDGCMTHRKRTSQADTAYRTAFAGAARPKMILDWRSPT